MEYTEKNQYGRRGTTDAQITSLYSPCDYHGVMDRHARFLEENQLLTEEDWFLFIQQFKTSPDDEDNGWRGEYFGKMMRGACMTYQYTQNCVLYNLLTEVVQVMLTAQDDLGRFSSYSLGNEFHGWDLWARKYVMLGLLHYYEVCKSESLRSQIIDALTKHLDYIVRQIYDKRVNLSSTSSHWNGINSASILEPVVRMYNLTGEKSYLNFAEYIVDFLCSRNADIFTLALENKLAPYQYPETKAYEIMSCFEGLLEYYRVTGIEKWKTAVINFVDAVAKNEITIIGCAGCMHELFDHALATQTDTRYTGIMQETCVTVTWMKLCNQLLMLTGESKYADYIEQSSYNALYGAINTEKAPSKDNFPVDSYSPLRLGTRGRVAGGYKTIAPNKYYGCCVAICAAGTALPLLTAVTKATDTIVFNYYENGTVCMDAFVLHIDTRYPADGHIRITFEKTGLSYRHLKLRIPAYAGSDTKIFVNGDHHCESSITPGSYLTISRQWADGDVIELKIDMAVRVHRPMGVDGNPESKNFLAITYGPLVLARDARIGEVGTAINPAESVELTPYTPTIPCAFCAEADLNGQKISMMDYGSAGKTWSNASQMEAWVKTI